MLYFVYLLLIIYITSNVSYNNYLTFIIVKFTFIKYIFLIFNFTIFLITL